MAGKLTTGLRLVWPCRGKHENPHTQRIYNNFEAFEPPVNDAEASYPGRRYRCEGAIHLLYSPKSQLNRHPEPWAYIHIGLNVGLTR